MFAGQKNLSIFREYSKLLSKKLDYSINATSGTGAGNYTIADNIKDVRKQSEILKSVGLSDENNLSQLLKEINTYFSNTDIELSEQNGKVSRTKERILIDSLKSELSQIITKCKTINDILNVQLEFLKAKRLEEYNIELKREEILALDLKKLLNDGNALELAFQNNLREVKKLLKSDLASSIVHKIAGMRARLSHHILRPLGTENIPLAGPVIFAPRHYGISGDITVLLDAIPRRVFTVQAAEWVRSDFLAGFYRNVFERSGFVPTIRPESQEQYNKGTAKDKYFFPDAASNVTLLRMISILSLNQALIIFPEGHPNITPVFTYKDKDSGIIPLKPGLAICLEKIENTLNLRVPVIPVGIIYDEKNKSLQANFGKPMYYIPRKGLSLRESLIANEPLRNVFNEALRSEIAKLSKVGLSDIYPKKLYTPAKRHAKLV